MSPTGLERDLGVVSLRQVLNAGEPAVGEELSTTQGETPGYECPPDCWSPWVGTVTGDIAGVLAKIVSHPFMPTLM